MTSRGGLLHQLGMDVPVVQAPMAGVQGSALCVAVSNAGGLGSLPCALLSLDAQRSELASIRAQTQRAFNVNHFCHAPPAHSVEMLEAWRKRLEPYYRELELDPTVVSEGAARAPFDATAANLLDEVRPAVVSFHFGLPAPELMERMRSMGACIIASATSVEEARWLDARGVDAIIAQGNEAGGHRGLFLTDDLTTQLGTFALVPQVVKAVRVPVIAAGGIADARGVAAALALGATAVQVGTAYLLCPEATTRPVHRAALNSRAAEHTALTRLFTGRPARGIVNRLMRELGPVERMAPPFPLAAAALAPLRSKAESQGSSDFSPLWAGQNASGCKPLPAAQLTRELAAT